MKKIYLWVALAGSLAFASCVDKYQEVDGDTKPEWLGSSIYAELEHPGSGMLSGTFATYLRLVDDLNYGSTLSRTGSKTVFPANDEAFERFFRDNDWGVRSYEGLSEAQKKLLLYSSMIDNALLLGMLPNVSNGTSEPTSGMAVKHATSVSVTDSVEHIWNYAMMPQNNKYWRKFAQSGIHVVSDATTPMMVHFTREHMINNNITTVGEGSDFEILTGEPFTEGTVYIFNNKVVAGDVTCQNGYIHQLENVLVPPGNMAQVIKKDGDTKLFSHLLDYFAAPYYDAATTNQYNDWALANGRERIDSIFQVRYLSSRSQNSTLIQDPNGASLSTSQVLSYDPGWNGYYPSNAYSTAIDHTITDIGAMFVPVDAAVKQYFLPGGNGEYLIDIYGKLPNTEENLVRNLDTLHVANPQILTAFVRNLQKPSFVGTVPSKFSSITNDASENMGMKLDLLQRKGDGKYDIKIANNGVVYKLNTLVVPDEYQAVLAPSSSYPDMQVMNWAVQDRSVLGVDFRFYLLAMSANYAFFIPDDEAFEHYYLDPASLGGTQPSVLRFYYDAKKYPALRVERYQYDLATHELGQRISTDQSAATCRSQLVDILNYHTVILDDGAVVGQNHFYKTKHGAAIYVDGGEANNHVCGGSQVDNGEEKSKIEEVYREKNGRAYRIDRVIQPTINSVADVLSSDDRFNEFLDCCTGFSADVDMLDWIGISKEPNTLGISPQDQYMIFTQKINKTEAASLNAEYGNVKMFNTYNYTLYAPDNAAMEKAYAAGLPRWVDIMNEYEDALNQESAGTATETELSMKKAEIWAKINIIRDFVRYHFQSVSLYADNVVDADIYSSLCSDELGVSRSYHVDGGNGHLIVTDAAGIRHDIDANDGSKLVNKMARDLWLGVDNNGTVNPSSRRQASAIYTSSFCAVHEVSEPFYLDSSKRFDGSWASSKAMAKTHRLYQEKKANNEL